MSSFIFLTCYWFISVWWFITYYFLSIEQILLIKVCHKSLHFLRYKKYREIIVSIGLFIRLITQTVKCTQTSVNKERRAHLLTYLTLMNLAFCQVNIINQRFLASKKANSKQIKSFVSICIFPIKAKYTVQLTHFIVYVNRYRYPFCIECMGSFVYAHSILFQILNVSAFEFVNEDERQIQVNYIWKDARVIKNSMKRCSTRWAAISVRFTSLNSILTNC